MTQEDKELLLADLCARLPYKVMIYRGEKDYIGEDDALLEGIDVISGLCKLRCLPEGTVFVQEHISNILPFLRPMSSITEEEKTELWELLRKLGMTADVKRLDWLNKKMFDYRGLIPKGLALEALEGMYNAK